MTDELTSTGLNIDDLETRTDGLITELQSTISPNLNLNVDTNIGQFTRIFSERAQALAELLQAIHENQYPNGANGFPLANLSALTGTIKRDATYSTLTKAQAEVYLQPSITLPLASVAHVTSDPTSRFVTVSAVTNSAVTSAWVSCAFSAESAGPVPALTSTLTVIAEAVTGWLQVRNNADATEGLASETDSELRLRRTAELQTGSTSTGALATALSQIDEISWVQVLENDTDLTDANGIPPHGIEAVIYGPTVTSLAVASTIYDNKAAGIRAHGDNLVPYTDSLGELHTIGYSTASVADIYLEIDCTVDANNYGGDTAVASEVVNWGDDNLGVGDDVVVSKISSLVFNIVGVEDVTEIRAGRSASPSGTTNVDILWNEIGDLDSARVTVTST